MSSYDYFLLTLPLFLWVMHRSVGTGLTKEICKVLQSIVINRKWSSSMLYWEQKEISAIISIIKLHVNNPKRNSVEYCIECLPQKTKFWYWGGSATILCKIRTLNDDECKCVLINVEYRQKLHVKPWAITKVTEIH